MTTEMTGLERVHAALNHEGLDCVPITGMGWTIGAFSGGYTTTEYAQDAKKMAKGQIAFYEKTGIDLLHPTSDMGQMAEGFGVKMLYKDGLTPMLDEFAVKEPEQWEELEVLDPYRDGRMMVSIEAIEAIRDELGDSVSIMPYAPSPLTSATHVRAMENVMIDIVMYPDLLKKGLEIMADTVIEYMDAMLDAGADGILYATTRASAEITTKDQYREFGFDYDKTVLESISSQDGMNILHVCGVEPLFKMLSELPNSNGINWWDMGSNLNMKEAKEQFGEKVCLVGGLDQTDALLYGTIEEVKEEARTSIEEGLGDDHTGFILAPGCEVSPENPLDKIRAASEVAHKYKIRG